MAWTNVQLRLKLIYREKRGIEGCAAFDICQGHTPVFKDLLHTPDILSSAPVYLHIYKSAQAPEVSICVVYQTEETKNQLVLPQDWRRLMQEWRFHLREKEPDSVAIIFRWKRSCWVTQGDRRHLKTATSSTQKGYTFWQYWTFMATRGTVGIGAYFSTQKCGHESIDGFLWAHIIFCMYL